MKILALRHRTAEHSPEKNPDLFQAAAHIPQSRLLIERYRRRGQLTGEAQWQSLSDGLYALAFVLEIRSQKEAR